MNILIATFSFPDPGIDAYDGRFVLSEALGYARNGASVLVVTPHYPGARCDEQMAPGVRVHRFRYFFPTGLQRLKVPGKPIYRTASLLALIQIPLLLTALTWNLIRHARWAHVIHAQWTLTGLLALPAKWLFGAKLVVTARGSDLRLVPGRLNRFLHRSVDAAIDCFGPQPWNHAYKAAHPAHFLTLPLIVDAGNPKEQARELVTAARDPTRPLILLYIGRFDRIKIEQNHLPLLDLIESAAILRDRAVPVRLFYLGSGEPDIERRMRAAIAAHDLGAMVSLLGPRSDVTPYVHACDLGIGGIALNGVAQDFTVNAKPQILMHTPDNDGTPWRDAENALIVEPNDPGSLAERIHWGEKNRHALAEIGQRARGDLRRLVTDTDEGGRLYLQAFAELKFKRG